MNHLEARPTIRPAPATATVNFPPQPDIIARPSKAYHCAQDALGVETLEQCVLRSLEQYFADLSGAKPHALHELVMQAVERPLLRFALSRCDGNQSAAAQLLGVNRNTLRKKLSDHQLI